MFHFCLTLRFGKLPDTSLIANSNLALIEKEVVEFQSAELTDKNRYKLSNLMRGQEGTEEYGYTAGENLPCLMIQ
ncbi:GTA baseplate fiber-binding domain-containing protein [Wolbachia endosymbiont of Wuchereria bancrofti]|uniref:GTA baseplate fiber-binding domain-containing protein n=1 Tax=Wolbachia endosymbiont of Wuchereria bancrofti TaxID=96496 RepID=UPI000B4D4F70|nr:hypothetical protein [Wolbachia endosymbiont of Wuchereria bancrofti]